MDEAEGETGIKFPGEDLRAHEAFHVVVAPRAGIDDGGRSIRIDAVLYGERHALEAEQALGAGQHVVDELHDMAGADPAGVEHVGADAFQHWLDTGELVRAGANHDSDGAGLGAATAAADRGVDEVDAARPDVRGHGAGGDWVTRGLVDDQSAAGSACEKAILAIKGGAHLGGGGQAEQDGVATGREIAQAGAGCRSHGGGTVDGGLAEVVDREFVLEAEALD